MLQSLKWEEGYVAALTEDVHLLDKKNPLSLPPEILSPLSLASPETLSPLSLPPETLSPLSLASPETFSPVSLVSPKNLAPYHSPLLKHLAPCRSLPRKTKPPVARLS